MSESPAALENPPPEAGFRPPGLAAILAFDADFGEALAKSLAAGGGLSGKVLPLPADSLAEPAEVVILAPGEGGKSDRPRRLANLKSALAGLRSGPVEQVILISSGAVYGVDHRATGFEREHAKPTNLRNREALWWRAVENEFEENCSPECALLLRVPLLHGGGKSCFADRIFSRRFLIRYAGFNPPLQFLSMASLAEGIAEAVRRRLRGVFHLTTDDAVPLRAALRCKKVFSLGVPRLLQRIIRPIFLRFVDGVRTTDQLNYLRNPWTLSGEKFAEETGLRFSSRAALAGRGEGTHAKTPSGAPPVLPEFDRFGCDVEYVRRKGKTAFRFAEKIYWRIEGRGYEHIPSAGAAVLVGPHRGFMPLDAVMMVHLVYQNTRRMPRFLVHPTLVKFPVQAPFFQRMGGVMACKRNAERLLDEGEILGVYPEGIGGAFKMYREAYNLESFGRPDYARWALKHNVPVIPFANVGSAEIYPIFARINWRWLKAWLEWPFFPITTTFPFLPFPLPTKWHIQFLPPVHPAEVRVEAEQQQKDPVEVFTEKVRLAINSATQEMLALRRSIFFGNIWGRGGENKK